MIALLLFLAWSRLLAGSGPAESRPYVAAIHFVDDTGRTRSVDEWRGTPTIVVPMYTRCPLVCPTIAEHLRRAMVDQNINNYRVVFFSFDPRDTPQNLRRFREQHRIPLAWTMAHAGPVDTRRFMDSIDVTYSDNMTHPSVVVFLTPDLRVATTVVGTNFSASDVTRALGVASGGYDWLGHYGALAFAVLLLVAVFAAIDLFNAL